MVEADERSGDVATATDSVLNIEANTNPNDLVLDEIMKYHDVVEGEVENNSDAQALMDHQEGGGGGVVVVEEVERFISDEDQHQSPIKSLSNLVSGPIINDPGSQFADPIAAKLTSCLCKRFDAVSSSVSSSSSSSAAGLSSLSCGGDAMSCSSSSAGGGGHHSKATRSLSASRSAMDLSTNGGHLEEEEEGEMQQQQGQSMNVPAASSSTSSSRLASRDQWLHRTANNPIVKSKPMPMGSKSAAAAVSTAVQATSTGHNMLRRTMSNPLDGTRAQSEEQQQQQMKGKAEPVTSTSASAEGGVGAGETPVAGTSSSTAGVAAVPVIDTRALAEASRNLTQTLKKLSKEVFTNKVDISESSSKRIGTGAVIESMKHHGKGIYSGTFSGTLNPALQDRYGRPKRDISTIIHILNDLLSATPQYRRGASISFDTGPGTQGSSSSSSSGSTSTSGSGSSHGHHHHNSHHHHHHHHHHKGSSSAAGSSSSSRGQVRKEEEN